MASGEVRIENLKDLRKELKKLEDAKPWLRHLTATNRDLARDVAGWSRAAAVAMGGQQAHFADALFGRATQTQARVEIAGPRSSRGKVRANPAFWGRLAHNPPNWIGASWDVGVSGEGPYAINEAIARRSVEIEARFRRLIDEVTGDAFPDGGT